jgi:hypothetical protein
MHRIIILGLLLFAVQTKAQQKMDQPAKKKFTFHSVTEAGLLEGEGSSAFQLKSVNGLQYKTWFGGIGVALDHYNIRTVPLFADIRKDILMKPSTPFAYAAVGTQIIWLRDKDKFEYGQQDFTSGLYYNAGAGYKLGIAKKHALLLSAGYSVKKISYHYSYASPCLVAQCPEYKNTTEYILRRLSFTLGFMF